MARVRYVGPSDAVELVDGTHCPHGAPVEVPDALATSLLEQDVWRPATTTKPNKPAEPEKAD